MASGDTAGLIVPASQRGALTRAARVVTGGGIVALPTETVFGLATAAGVRSAEERLRRLKGRSRAKPFQVLASSARRVARECRMTSLARRLASAFWPGPLTLVLRSMDGRWTGFRVPSHPVAQGLLRRCGGLMLATSANRAGDEPALLAAEAAAMFGARIDMTLDGDPPPTGAPSSVVRAGADGWQLLREGALSRETLIEAAGMPPCGEDTQL